MRPDTIDLYKSKCSFDKQCKPEPRFRQYLTGATHYVTQCGTCGCSFGYPFAKALLDPNADLKPFDDEFESKYYEEVNRDLFTLIEKQQKLNSLRKQIKSDFFQNILKLPFDNFEIAYNAYLASPHWQEKRKRILNRDNFECRYCNSARATQVHHLSYDNLGNESDFELISVCYSCHATIHDIENCEKLYDRSQRKEL